MGAAGAPKTFHKWMGCVLDRLFQEDRQMVRHYQDDIIITARGREDLINRSRRVNDLVTQYAKINPEKSYDGDLVPILGTLFNNAEKVVTVPLLHSITVMN